MATQSGTFTSAQQQTATLHYLRPGEVVRTTLTVTGTATVQLQESIGPNQARRALASYTATGTYDYRNETKQALYLHLLAIAVIGSVAYTVADITGDQVLIEDPISGGWYRSDGTRVGYMSDEGFVGPVFTPSAQGGAVNLFDYMTPAQIADVTGGTSALDHSDAWNAMLAAAGVGGAMEIPAGTYNGVGITGSANFQRIIGIGKVILKKNANGVLFTHTGSYLHFENIDFRGDASTPVYTGHNVVVSGDDVKFQNCGSRYAYARALLATGQHLQVIGSNEIWATADTSGSGYDIEVGVSGTATLYHQLKGIVSTQNTGGLKFIDCGSQVVQGGQFGKYTVASGTAPAGVNAGILMGCRVLGAVTIDLSSSVLIGNQFGASATITYAVGTSGHEYWGNVDSDATLTNNGNHSSAIVRQVSSDGIVGLLFGGDTSLALWRIDPASGRVYVVDAEIPNNKNYRAMRASPNEASAAWTLGASTSDNVSFAALVGSHQWSVIAGQAFQNIIAGIVKLRTDASGLTLGDGTTSASPGGASSNTRNVKPVSGITDATLTTVATITIPNAAHACTIRFTLLGALGAGGAIGADEAVAENTYYVTIARVAGVNAVLNISSAVGASASNVAGAATVTATLALAAVSGAVGASNTCAVQATITKSGGSSAAHTALVSWEILNARATGVTVA